MEPKKFVTTDFYVQSCLDWRSKRRTKSRGNFPYSFCLGRLNVSQKQFSVEFREISTGNGLSNDKNYYSLNSTSKKRLRFFITILEIPKIGGCKGPHVQGVSQNVLNIIRGYTGIQVQKCNEGCIC